jgi:hypothetical protein
MNDHLGFLTAKENNVIASVNGVFMVSSTTAERMGVKLCDRSMRKAIALFCVRTIPKQSWKNSHNVYRAHSKK